VELHPGDTIYIPRGTPHQAHTVGLRSLHVTLGWYQPRISDVIMLAVQEAARENVALRRGLRPGWSRDVATKDALTEEARTLIQSIGKNHISKAIDTAACQRLLDALEQPQGYLNTVDGLDALNGRSVLQIAADGSHTVRDCLFYVEIVMAGRTVTFPSSYAAPIEQLQGGPAALCELKDLPETDRIRFARNLVLSGIARIVS
jgi:ribosomal protein L16 Arg81 hydroxylase